MKHYTALLPRMNTIQAGRYAPPEMDWVIAGRNKEWHEKYFAKKACQDHQAKGNCESAIMTLEYMEEQGWLHSGDVILDPMCGIGTFLIMAAMKGYNAIGVELEEKYYLDMIGYDEEVEESSLFAGVVAHIEGSVERFSRMTEQVTAGRIQVFNGDARELKKVLMAFPGWSKINVLCSPPYGNRLRDSIQQAGSRHWESWSEMENEEKGSYDAQYSNNAANIGNAKIQVLCSPPYTSATEQGEKQASYLAGYTGHKEHKYSKTNIAVLKDSAYNREMLKVYKSLYSVLSVGSYVALVTENFIQAKRIVLLDRLTIELMENAGFTYIETKRAQIPEISFLKRINYNKHHSKQGLPMIDWEDITFYVKEGD